MNISEASGRAGKDRIHMFRIAYASAHEADMGIELLVLAGHLEEGATTRARGLLDRVRAMTWRLMGR